MLFEAEFKELELRLKYGSFHLKLYSNFQDLAGAQLKPGFVRFKPRLKFIKFGHWEGNFIKNSWRISSYDFFHIFFRR